MRFMLTDGFLGCLRFLTVIVLWHAHADVHAGNRAGGASGAITGKVFRGSSASIASVAAIEVRKSMLEEIDGVFTVGAARERITALQEELRPLFEALPTNAEGNLGHDATRYLLHRFLLHQHGWLVHGLKPGVGGTWQNGSPVEILKDRVPDYIQGLFEKQLGELGFGLREVAVFASTIQRLVHNEAISRLGTAFRALNLSSDARLGSDEIEYVLETYLALYIIGEVEDHSLNALLSDMGSTYPAWPDTQAFVRDIHRNVVFESRDRSNPFGSGPSTMDFNGVLALAERLDDEFGRHRVGECMRMKATLVAKERSIGSGRVKLADFYAGDSSDRLHAANSSFSENVDYLRQLGALDESTMDDPSVIVPNYVYSMSNCIGASSYYSVCCPSECEAIQSQVETELANFECNPRDIVQVVSNISSSSVKGPRVLHAGLVDRLDGIARAHGGTVPIHGRLFAQWLHHAFPRECPWPFPVGKTKPLSRQEWLVTTGTHFAITVEDRVEIMDKQRQFSSDTSSEQDITTGAQSASGEEDELPWSEDEELYVIRPTAAPHGHDGVQSGISVSSCLSKFFMIAILFAMAVNVVRFLDSARKGAAALGLPSYKKLHV